MSTATRNQIEALKGKIEALDYRIGRLMFQRVDLEEKLAKLYEQRDGGAPRRDRTSTPEGTAF